MGCCGKPAEERHGNTRVAPEKGNVQEDLQEDTEGPLKKRSCTDIFCLLLLLANIGGMGYVGYLGTISGDPFRILYGMDSYGNTCHRKNRAIDGAQFSGMDMRNKPKVFYFNILSLMQPGYLPVTSTILCVEKCPTLAINTVSDLTTYATNKSVQLCRYDILPASYSNGSNPSDTCPSLPLMAHRDLLNRCVPEAFLTTGTSALGILSSTLSLLEATCTDGGDFFTKSANDIVRTWKEICYLMLITIVVAFLIVVLMRFIAPILVWGMVIICAVGCLAGTGYCWYRYLKYKWALDDIAEADRTDTEKKTVKNWLIYSIIVSIVAAIILLVLLILRKRLALVVQLFREASKAVVSMPFLLIQPLWTLLALICTTAVVGFVFLYIETAGDPTVDSEEKVEFKPDQTLWYLKWYYIFGMLWSVALIFACHQMTIAGAVATWYFTREKPKVWFPVLSSIGRLIRYHMGTVAFGSFLIAVIWFFKIVLAYIQNKLRGKAGPFVDFMLKCLQCALWCFEKFIKFINQNAYIMTAIFGYNFCRAAARGFSLVVSNVLRVAAINSVGAFVLVLGKVGVVAIVIVIGYEFFIHESTDGICFFWVPLTVAGIGSMVISHTFIGVYGMMIDTIFMCFLEDSEKNDGVTKPYFMSRGLMEYVENSRKALEADEKRAEARALKEQQAKT